jgi:hypothetical protein
MSAIHPATHLPRAQNIIGGIGSATTITYFLSPLFVVYRLIRYGEGADETPFLIYVFTILNCEFWALYGVIEKTWPVYVTNFTGLTLNLTYLVIFILFQKRISTFKRGLLSLSVISGLILSFLFFYFFIPSQTIIGTLAAVADMCMGFSPFQYVNQMYKEKNNDYIPLSITVFLWLNNVVWTTFGFVKEIDCFIILPNFLGLLFNTVQIFMWAQFYDPKKNKLWKGEEDEQLALKGNVF